LLSRAKAVIYQDGDTAYCAVSFDPLRKTSLDPIGLWSWFLVDGEVTTAHVLDKIQQQYDEIPRYEAQYLIDDLVASGLIIESRGGAESGPSSDTALDQAEKTCIPSLNVCFLHFPRFDPINSYLVWLFGKVADTVSIVSEAEQADVVLHFNVIDPAATDTVNILVADAPDQAQIAKSDYVISTSEALSPHHLKWLRLPDNALETREPLTDKMVAGDGSGFHIDRLSDRFRDFLIGEPVAEKVEPPALQDPLLTIGMATYDDYDGVYFSLVSLQLHHPEVFAGSEVVILDNNPGGPASKALMALAQSNSNVRYEPYSDKNSTAVRDVLFHLATAPWVLCMDSHVMYPPQVLTRLLDYMQANPTSIDLLQGPLLDDSAKPHGTHFVEGWRYGMYGYWGWDKRADDLDAEAFEIPMQGLGAFACRKAAWPGFNPLFNGFGGEEGYIHEKIRQKGGRCLCLPFFRWSHRFARPHGPRYTVKWGDRIRNYFIGFNEIGYDTDQIRQHFTELVNEEIVNDMWSEAERLSHSPFAAFDHIACINLDPEIERWCHMMKRFKLLGIDERVKRFSAVHTPEFHHIGCALSHRKIIEQAKRFGYRNVVVFEDDALMLSGAEVFLSFALKELEKKPWKILYLGGAQHGSKLKFSDGCEYLMEVPEYSLTCSHAIAYHHSVYDELLEALPDNEAKMADWLVEHIAIDQYLMAIDSKLMVFPKPFTQPVLRDSEDPRFRSFYQ